MRGAKAPFSVPMAVIHAKNYDVRQASEEHGVLMNTGVKALNITSAALWLTQASISATCRLVIAPSDETAELFADALRFFSSGKWDVETFPGLGVLPYDIEAPHGSVISQRSRLLRRLSDGNLPGVIIASSQAVLQRMPGQSFWEASQIHLAVGAEQTAENVIQFLVESGYRQVEIEINHYGEFSIQEGAVNVFSSAHPTPIRIRFSDGTISAISFFSITTQVSTHHTDEVTLSAMREIPLDETSFRKLRFSYRNMFCLDHDDSTYRAMRDGVIPGGIEAYMPLAVDETAILTDFLNTDVYTFMLSGAKDAMLNFARYARDRYQDALLDPDRKPLPPGDLWIEPDEALRAFSGSGEIGDEVEVLSGLGIVASGASYQPTATLTSRLLRSRINRHKKTIFFAASETRTAQIEYLLNLSGVAHSRAEDWPSALKSEARVVITTSSLLSGLSWPDSELLLVSENEIFGAIRQSAQSHQKESTPKSLGTIYDFASIARGDLLVHLKYGIGTYGGIEAVTSHGVEKTYVTINYKNDARVFVDVLDLDQVAPYRAPTTPEKSDITSSDWIETIAIALSKIEDMAADVISLRNKKAILGKTEPIRPNYKYTHFLQDFPFRETVDQASATGDIISDLSSGSLMDRVVCGDVGFGKTEVAMRAAFIVAESGKDVVILAPTTILARQHYETFLERFKATGIPVAYIEPGNQSSRKSLPENGIIVGTHTVLSKWDYIKNPGLIIIDEEHKFGVKQKELILSTKRSKVHSLALTATPIPRTLHMAFSGVRDFSVLATPPAKRLSIRTVVSQHSDARAKEAIQREMLRGGQVFWIHNKVTTINECAEMVRRVVPGARVGVVHGQMHADVLLKTMRQFSDADLDVLVSTTIVEIGIDVPNSNTIIIECADQFGLAQLHQLRGRVGRSSRQAYAYLMTSEAPTERGVERLRAMEQATDLGDGFVLAYRDLEIRGAGEILGDEQSGCIQRLGYGLYSKLLPLAITAVQNGNDLIRHLEDMSVKIDIILEGRICIPEAYMPHETTRAFFYKRFAGAETTDQVISIGEEMTDRFGDAPEEAKRLLEHSKVAAMLKSAGITSLIIRGGKGYVVTALDSNVSVAGLFSLIRAKGLDCRITSHNRIDFDFPEKSERACLQLAKEMVSEDALVGA